MDGLATDIDRVAQDSGFSGVVRVDVGGEVVVAKAYGLADRGHGVANTIGTRLALASGVKGLTAVTVMALVETGALSLSTTARSLLGTDLPLIDDAVTVEHLLGHRSGIGDYVHEEDEGDINENLLTVPAHTLATTEGYVPALDGHPTDFAPGARFSYCNSGFVVLALLAERATGTSFPDLVATHVCRPAGMGSTAFLRTDELPGDTALGYLDREGLRTNVLHLPVRGCGDGGIFSTAADVHAFWAALLDGRLLPAAAVDAMVERRSETDNLELGYGLGFWLDGGAISLEGYDAGVSFRSVHHPQAATTHTVIANWSDGAWPLGRLLRDRFPA